MAVLARPISTAPYAFGDGESEGRRHPEPKHPYRTDFQRDRDRIIHSTAFRRLENKTQVFGVDFSDHFRNRLTHTLEVAQIARTVAYALQLNADLCETLALSHDIGHPPFSHEGESALDENMRRHGLGFEHNLHALVIVEEFEERYASFRGLNLTFEVREGIVKHSRDYNGSEVLHVDLSEYHLGLRPPLEAQLIDLADEIAYNSADLDDGHESGLLKLDVMRAESSLFDRLHGATLRRHPQASSKLQVRETLRRLIDHLVTSLIEETRRRLASHGIRSSQDVRRHSGRIVGFDDETAAYNFELKSLLRRNLYEHPNLRRPREQARRITHGLFAHFSADPRRLPPDHYQRLEEQGPLRTVCNYIAGMTDTFARSTWQRLGLASAVQPPALPPPER